MSVPAITPPTDGGAGGAEDTGTARAAGDLRDLDARGVVAAIVEQRVAADRAEARLLALAVHFVDLHPVVPGRWAASWDPDEKLPVVSLLRPRREKPQPVPGSEGTRGTCAASRSDRIAGEGTPGVAEYAVEELGAALGVPYRTALTLVADAVELCYRLPRLWGLVQAGRLQAWKARQVAQLTIGLSAVVAGFVDRHLAHEAARNRVPTVGRLRALVHEALLQCDPEVAAAREETALARRGVWFDHRESTATTQMTATLDTLDALDLDNTISDLADQMRALGDTTPLDVRRAHALGTLAHPQHLLDLTGGETSEADYQNSAPVRERPVPRLRSKHTTHLYVHVSLADLLTGLGTCDPGESLSPTGWVERFGPATVDLLRDWLARADSIQLRPVLHTADPGTGAGSDQWPAADRHDPPEWMREVVILRDGHCVFPGCTIDARGCDQDHIDPYVAIDEGGPPGQTSVEKLACLCRRHHRLKTFTGWRYHRLPDGDYEWTSPTGHTYTASPTPKR